MEHFKVLWEQRGRTDWRWGGGMGETGRVSDRTWQPL